jgi:hypothetical protein
VGQNSANPNFGESRPLHLSVDGELTLVTMPMKLRSFTQVWEKLYLCQLGLADADLREQELHSSHLIRCQISAITGSRDAISRERPSEYSMEV